MPSGKANSLVQHPPLLHRTSLLKWFTNPLPDHVKREGKAPMESQTSSSIPKQQQASLNQTSHPYGAVPPCYGNFDKQSTAPKQPLVTIPPPMVMPIFVAQNPQPSSTTPNISVLEVADPREPLTPSLETTYATPLQAAVGAPVDMAGKPSRTAIPHLARPIPLRLDDLCINTLPLCYRQHQSIPPDQEEFLIRSHSLNQLGLSLLCRSHPSISSTDPTS
ncbi:hypothetical protein FH972_025289 [Carpinus fangiana]|uniref:Uncharacterized protein n=1 Tax=Carpinus fangiana TaxID=176857 RepID=A0A5N6L0L9_9ROSI|nr:hypothetical protein FH972_025289 [Carpinus fangiana]